ncbi:MAG TPA: hypothetical protein EYP07_16160, partial [Kiloniellaceae bacterium]|nr:hypothetical protein [Kiloniellaceae bacterium]
CLILPGDEAVGFAGADAAGVMAYARNALFENRHSGLRHHLPGALLQLRQLATASDAEFTALNHTAQQQLLQQILSSRAQPFASVFEQLIGIALEGLLCEPVHGGNRDYCGWWLMGYQPGQGARSTAMADEYER